MGRRKAVQREMGCQDIVIGKRGEVTVRSYIMLLGS